MSESLMEAVERNDVEAVRECLARGADPNYARVLDGYEPDHGHQPTTPLRLVMFRISDSLLDDRGLEQLAAIARLLLQHGADPKPAMRLAELRYGKYDPQRASSPFMDVWHIVANAE